MPNSEIKGICQERLAYHLAIILFLLFSGSFKFKSSVFIILLRISFIKLLYGFKTVSYSHKFIV